LGAIGNIKLFVQERLSERGIDNCKQKFPDNTNPLSPDFAKFALCQQAALSVCSLGFFAVDPAGATAAEVGGAAGKGITGGGGDE
jgi:hypothetical protein